MSEMILHRKAALQRSFRTRNLSLIGHRSICYTSEEEKEMERGRKSGAEWRRPELT